MPPKKLLLLDGFSLFFRAFYALPPSLTHNGKPINAVLGFASLLFNSIEKFNPDYVCVCIDSPVQTFRHKLYKAYKGHRPEPPDDFRVQIPIWKEFLEKTGIKSIAAPGYEADDLIGTLSLKFEKHGECFIMTGDQDALQLASDATRIVLNKKGISDLLEMGPEQIKEKYQLTPAQLIDLKALKGDTSDNIPGVAGIGEKTALSLLEQYPSLDKIYAHLDDITSKSVQAKLRENKEMAYLSKQLVTIDRHVPTDATVEDLAYRPNWNAIMGCFREYEFKNLYKKYESKLTGAMELFPTATAPDGHYQLVEGKFDFDLLKHGFAVDLETTALALRQAKIVGVSIAVKEKQAFYLTDHLEKLRPYLEDPKIPKYTHNGKYEYGVLLNYGITLRGIAFDSLLAAYLLYPGERLGLKDLVKKVFGVQMSTYEDMVGKGKTQINFADVPPEKAAQYAGADSDFTLRLKNKLEPELKAKGLTKIFETMEMPLQIVLAKMEYEGVCLDSDYLKKLHHEFEKKNEHIVAKIHQLAGEEFNISSTQQLGKILFDKLGLPVVKNTKTARSTDSSVLEKLRPMHEIAGLVLDYRTIEKLQNTYVTVLPTLVDPTTKKIHASFNQTIAITGRLSSADPNLQNIPIRTEEGAKIRRAFIPSAGNIILSADYSQVELRLMAHMAQDKHMIEAFKKGEDIHASTAKVVNVSRSEAKAVNFGIIYGISDYGLSQKLGIKRAEAKVIIDNYFANFPSIKTFMAETIEFARANGFVKTEFGRIRNLPEIHSSNWNLRQFAERTAVNSRLQGTAADIIKLAMIHIQDRLEKEKLKSKMIISVHDELVFDVVPAEKEKMLALVKEGMEGVVNYSVPLSVDAVFGPNWQEIS